MVWFIGVNEAAQKAMIMTLWDWLHPKVLVSMKKARSKPVFTSPFP
jgi:hypothetical protein